MNEELSDEVKRFIRILEENIDILSNLESSLEDEKENELVSDLKLHDLYDLTEDVADSSRLKRAESNLMRRKTDNFS
jgi:flagellin-specific chaperone FliS